jgi:hypothetical protein
MRHAFTQIVGYVADGIETGVARLGAAFKMTGLGDRPASQHANVELGLHC